MENSNLKIINVDIKDREYNIYIGSSILKDTAKDISKNYLGKRVAIISDETVTNLYANDFKTQLEAVGLEVHIISFPVGEVSKSIEQATIIYKKLIEYEITRSDVLVAIGGGVTGDLTGFISATYLRGLDFIQIPTTLLAQVDSSVGGKTGVNLSEGKNLVGCFKQPKAVYIDTDVLQSLKSETYADGMAEIIKHACIADAKMFDLLNSGIYDINELVANNCTIKKTVVEEDETEKGRRMILNFGHTFAHAIEKHYNYKKYTHGEAVAIGMYAISKIGEKLGYSKVGTAEKIKNLTTKHQLPYEMPRIELNLLTQYISADKKNKSGVINAIFISEIGNVEIIKQEAKKLAELYVEVCE